MFENNQFSGHGSHSMLARQARVRDTRITVWANNSAAQEAVEKWDLDDGQIRSPSP